MLQKFVKLATNRAITRTTQRFTGQTPQQSVDFVDSILSDFPDDNISPIQQFIPDVKTPKIITENKNRLTS